MSHEIVIPGNSTVGGRFSVSLQDRKHLGTKTEIVKIDDVSGAMEVTTPVSFTIADATVTNDLDVGNDLAVNGDLTVSGTLSAAGTLADVVDLTGDGTGDVSGFVDATITGDLTSATITGTGTGALSGYTSVTSPTIVATTEITAPGGAEYKYADMTLAALDVTQLNAFPITVVPAPAAGRAVIFDKAALWLDFATTAYDNVGAGEDLVFKYTNAAGEAVSSTVETTGFLDAVADAFAAAIPASTAPAIVPAAAIVLHLLSGEVATGDSPLKVRVWYWEIPLSW